MIQQTEKTVSARNILLHEPYLSACAKYSLPVATAEMLIEKTMAGFTPSEKPVILHMLGIPGAGKSTLAYGMLRPNTLMIGFDSVMESLPDYAQDKQTLGKVAAYERWTDVAREIGYEILFRSVEQGLNILFDHGGARADHADLLVFLKEHKGYRVEMAALMIEPDLAAERAFARERHLPPKFIGDRYLMIQGLLPRYQDIADDFKTYQSTKEGTFEIAPEKPLKRVKSGLKIA